MQLLGILSAVLVIMVGFIDRSASQSTISGFDAHALFIILCGSFGAVFLGSKPKDFVRTILAMGEVLPLMNRYSQKSQKLERLREEFETLWLSQQKKEALSLVEASDEPYLKLVVDVTLLRASQTLIEHRFQNLVHKELSLYEPVIKNFDLLSKLGPSFGIIGTITGMVQIFKDFANSGSELGASMSLALLATLYGITFGAAIFGPLGSFWNRLIDERLQVIERLQSSAFVIRSSQEGGVLSGDHF